MSLRRSLALVAAVTLVGMLTVVGTASAAPTLTVDPTSVAPGGTVTVSGTECYWQPGEARLPGTVNVALEESVEIVAADDDGNWSVVLAAPGTPGSYQLTATCDIYLDDFEYAPQAVTVTAPPTATIGEVTRAGCQVSIPVTTTGTGPFTLTVWDDGEVVDDVDWDTPSAAEVTTVLSWLISEPAKEAAAGVGFVVTVSSVDGDLAVIPNWEYPPSAADACADAGDMSVALIGYPGSVAPGGTVQIEASGFYPDEDVTVVLHSDPVQLATLTADANGTVSGSLTIPSDTPLGSHTLVLTGVLSLLSTQIQVVVASAGSTTPPPPATVTPTGPVLAATGVDTTGLGFWGFGLLLAGGAFLALARRRPTTGEHRSDAD